MLRLSEPKREAFDSDLLNLLGIKNWNIWNKTVIFETSSSSSRIVLSQFVCQVCDAGHGHASHCTLGAVHVHRLGIQIPPLSVHSLFDLDSRAKLTKCIQFTSES